jgi:hypothetical protein
VILFKEMKDMQCELLLGLLLVHAVAIILIFAIICDRAKQCRINTSVVNTAIIAFTIITIAVIAGVVVLKIDDKGLINAKTSCAIAVKANAYLNSANISSSIAVEPDTGRR